MTLIHQDRTTCNCRQNGRSRSHFSLSGGHPSGTLFFATGWGNSAEARNRLPRIETGSRPLGPWAAGQEILQSGPGQPSGSEGGPLFRSFRVSTLKREKAFCAGITPVSGDAAEDEMIEARPPEKSVDPRWNQLPAVGERITIAALLHSRTLASPHNPPIHCLSPGCCI